MLWHKRWGLTLDRLAVGRAPMWLPELVLPQIKSRPKHCSALRKSCRLNRHVVAGPCWQVALSNDQISFHLSPDRRSDSLRRQSRRSTSVMTSSRLGELCSVMSSLSNKDRLTHESRNSANASAMTCIRSFWGELGDSFMTPDYAAINLGLLVSSLA